MVEKIDQPEKYWDRLFAPSSCLAVITTVDAAGAVNGAVFGTCTRVLHNPVHIAFTTTRGNHTAENVLETGEFTVNTPAFRRDLLDRVVSVALPFARGVDEIEKAGLTSIPARAVRPPRVAECNRHFECRVEWTREWAEGRLMVCGALVAASVDADCVDAKGYLDWNRVRPAHYAGAPYGTLFVGCFDALEAQSAYRGPEWEAFEAHRRGMFEDI